MARKRGVSCLASSLFSNPFLFLLESAWESHDTTTTVMKGREREGMHAVSLITACGLWPKVEIALFLVDLRTHKGKGDFANYTLEDKS